MTKQLKPIIHARDHMPGGADPLACVCVPPTATGDYDAVVLALSPYAYWRLGEASGPWEDTSGYPSLDPADLTLDSGTVDLTADVTGALTTGDDGAIQFNYDGSAAGGGDYIRGGGGGGTGKPFDLVEMTVTVWANLQSSAATRRGVIIGNTGTAVTGLLSGWALEVIYPTMKVRFTRGQVAGSVGSPELYAETPDGVAPGEWVLLTGSYTGDTIRLHINGALIDETDDPSGTAAAGGTDGVRVGWGAGEPVSGSNAFFTGTADEAVVWNTALTTDEIGQLYAAGSGTSTPGSGVLVPDGNGGATWGKVTTDAIEDEAVTPAKLAPGDDGDVLQTIGGAAEWAPFTATSDPADDTLVWMPLTTVSAGVPELVWGGDDSLIPTLIPL